MQGGWNAKVGKHVYENWQDTFGPICNDETNKRGLRLLEFAPFNDLVLANSLVTAKHPEDGPGIAKLDNTITRLITL